MTMLQFRPVPEKPMTTTFRSGLVCVLLALGGILAPPAALAQAWPMARPVRIITGYAPGGSTDVLSRMVAQHLQEFYKQSFIVEYKPGAGGTIGSEFVAKATPDGYTLLLSSVAAQVIGPVVHKISYDGVRDFTHLAILGGPPTTLAVGPALAEVKDMRAFIALAKAKPNAIGYATPGNGTHGHLIAELFKQLAGIQISHVPYKGSGQAATDVVAGHVPAGSLTVAILGQHLRSGKVRGLASTSAKRIADHPDIPTFAELGYPELTGITWFGIAGPAGLPGPIAEGLNREIRKAVQSELMRERLAPEGFEFPDYNLSQTLEYVRSETRRWQPIARASAARND
jgi:tripartite-type tricarboxylate transporter receptor subunit TctC